MTKLIKNWWLLLIAGIAYIILGFLVWNHPGETLLVAAIYIGIILLITGISQTVMAIRERDGMEKWGLYLAFGLVDIVLGAIILFNPIATAVAFTLILGIWFLFTGIMQVVNSFRLKKEGVEYWWLGLISGIVITVFGFLITGKPLSGAMALVTLISFGFWFKGIILIIISFGVRKVKRKVGDAKEAVVDQLKGAAE